MSSKLEDGLRALAEATQRAKTIRVELDAGYLRRIADVDEVYLADQAPLR